MTPVLRVEGLVRRFEPGRAPVIDGLSFELHAGEYVAIMGESGVGKSTLLNLIAGLDRPDGGRITLGGEELTALDDDARTLNRRRSMGFVFQAFHVLPYLSVARNAELPLELLGWPAAERETRVAEVLGEVGLARYAARLPRELSGGELQRVAIARALVHRPRLLLADEPTGNLDPVTAAGVLELLKSRVAANGGAGILITHSVAAAATADRAFRLDGRTLTPLAVA